MVRLHFAFLLLVLLGAGNSSRLGAQEARAPRTAADSAVWLEGQARRLIGLVPYPTFVTVGASGSPQARTVQPLLPDSNWTVWFATNPRTRKVAEIRRNPRVALHYFEPASLSYVTLIGRARVVRDRRTKDAHWTPAWDAFYPDRDSSVVLIAVAAERLEVVSTGLQITGDPRRWRPPSVRVGPRRR